MKKNINLGLKNKAISGFSSFNKKNYLSCEIEIKNIHLKEVNTVCGKKIFDKNSLYVRTSTLWELMQPEGEKGKHHFHGLSPEEIYESLKGLVAPYCIYESYESRYVIATICKNFRNEHYVVVIELHASLSNNRNANVNKLVSIYPKKNLENIIDKIDSKLLIFKK